MVNPLMNYSGVRVLITGHTGFKGAWLSKWLTMLGADVTGVSLPINETNRLFHEMKLDGQIDHIEVDIRNRDRLLEVVRSSRPDIVFHLAAQPLVINSYRDPLETFDTNFLGSLNILEAVRTSANIQALVYVTSDKCYKIQGNAVAYREDDCLGGHDPYSASKAAAEILFASYRNSFFSPRSIRAASVRSGNVIGGGDWSPNRIVPDCIRSLSTGDPLVLRYPSAVRPWQHVLDPLHGYLQLGSRLMANTIDSVSALNFGPHPDESHTVGDLVAAVSNCWPVAQLQLEIVDPDQHESSTLLLDSSLARNCLGWTPLFDFHGAVRVTVDWYYRTSIGEEPAKVSAAQIEAYMEEKG
jgi:CDP-glucose 4,6-dehydratase